MRTKFPAFTISELLVSMLISSILMYSIWNIYLFLLQYQNQVAKKSEGDFQVVQAEFLLTKDFQEAIEISSEGSILIFYSAHDSLRYQFDNFRIIRNHHYNFDTLVIPSSFDLVKGDAITLSCCLGSTETGQSCFTLEKPVAISFQTKEKEN